MNPNPNTRGIPATTAHACIPFVVEIENVVARMHFHAAIERLNAKLDAPDQRAQPAQQ